MARWGVILVALIGLASPARATDWVLVGADSDAEHFVDDDALARAGEVVRLAKRVVFREPRPMGDTPGMPLMKETTGVVECDCVRLQHRAVSLVVVGTDGKALWSSGDMKRVWESIEPDTPGRATLDFACARTAP